MNNNFEQISELLQFDNEDEFYFIQVIKRRKENPEMKTNARIIDNFYIYKEGDLEKMEEKITKLCKLNNARAYINLNRRSLKLTALHTSKLLTDYIIQGQFKACKSAYTTACGNHNIEKVKLWMIDIDAEEIDLYTDMLIEIARLQKLVKHKNGKVYQIISVIPTKNGFHIITNPFPLDQFNKSFPGITINKNSPTILYIP